MNKYYNYILDLIKKDNYQYIEDMIDLIQDFYKSNKITLRQRNKLLNIL